MVWQWLCAHVTHGKTGGSNTTRAATRQECCPRPEKRRVQSCAITSHQTIPEQQLVQSDPITSVSNFRLVELSCDKNHQELIKKSPR